MLLAHTAQGPSLVTTDVSLVALPTKHSILLPIGLEDASNALIMLILP